MSEAGDDESKYKIRKERTGEVSNNSRDYTGLASAEYSNGDSYTGGYKDGVHQPATYLSLSLRRLVTVRGSTNGRTGSSTMETSSETRSTASHELPTRSMALTTVTPAHNKSLLMYSLGFFENGKRHGEGTFTYQNGDKYSGWWQYGVKAGQGTYSYAKDGMRVRNVSLGALSNQFLARRELGE